jgi:hypothetical protein
VQSPFLKFLSVLMRLEGRKRKRFMGTNDQDLAFSDEILPEGWPQQPTVDEILEAEWIEGKSPSSVALRRYHTELLRFLRTNISSTCTLAERQERLQLIRKHHREYLNAAIKFEAAILEIRRKLLKDWELWCTRPEGGIQ